MRLFLPLAVAVLAVASPAAQAQPFVTDVMDFLGAPDGASLMFVHGRDATGVGAAFNFEVLGAPRLHLDIGVVTSNRGNTRLLPGLSYDLGRARPSNATVALGLCWTPSEYGAPRLGPASTFLAPYMLLRRGW